jgi:hypothetical protein
VLTQKGIDLFPVVTALWQWGEKYFFEAGERHPVLRDRLTKKLIPKLEVLAADGRRLRHTDTTLMPQG